MAVNTTTLAGILAASKVKPAPAPVARYIPSYAAPTGKTTQQVTKANTAAVKANPALAPKSTPVSTQPKVTTPGTVTAKSGITGDSKAWIDPGDVDLTDTRIAYEKSKSVTRQDNSDDSSDSTTTEPEYNVYDDPFYQQALQGAQSRFNLDRADAEARRMYEERGINRQLEDRKGIAEQQRRRLAGNFAARGMAGGRAGVLTRAEAETNAREITMRTGLREQIAELGRQFTSQFGAPGTDWLGTRAGMEAQQAALQMALNNRLAGLTRVG